MFSTKELARPEIATQLSELMLIFAVKFVKRFERQLKTDLSPLQMHILFFIGCEGPQTMSQLGQTIRVSKQQMTPLIDRLIDLELVTRSHALEDRRSVSISLSEKGFAFIEDRKTDAASMIQLLLASLPDEDVATIGRSSLELADALRKLPDYEGEPGA